MSRRPKTWYKREQCGNVWIDTTPSPGRTFTRDTWPPRGRGRGESLTSARRIAAKMRAVEVVRLRLMEQCTWEQIAAVVGFKDASGAYRAYWRLLDRVNWDQWRTLELAQNGGPVPI